MNDPNVILRIDRHTCNCPNEPVIRERFRPERIDFERRDMVGVLRHEERRRQQQRYAEVLHFAILRRLLRKFMQRKRAFQLNWRDLRLRGRRPYGLSNVRI